jgi:hypothetical protein
VPETDPGWSPGDAAQLADPAAPPSDPELLAEADAAYRPPPAFAEWAATPLDAGRWDAARERLEERRSAAPSEGLRRAVETATRAAAIDTGAIEGLYDVDRAFTVSVAMRTLGWQAAVVGQGDLVLDLFQAQLRAYELALEAATARTPVTEAWIREVHAVVSGPVPDREPTPGEYKRHPNHVRLGHGRVHSYAPVGDTAAEMGRLVEELAADDFAAAHPVLQAAYAHHAVAAIHPFTDGNGRVARALASVYLFRAASVPLLVFGDQKREYLDGLAEADEGDCARFAGFVLDRAEAAMLLAADSLGAGAEDRLAALRGLAAAPGAAPEARTGRLGSALLDAVASALSERISLLPVPAGVELSVRTNRGSEGGGEVALAAALTSVSGPAAETRIDVTAADDGALCVRAHGLDEALDVRLADVDPAPTAELHLRLDTWASRVVAALLDRLL